MCRLTPWRRGWHTFVPPVFQPWISTKTLIRVGSGVPVKSKKFGFAFWSYENTGLDWIIYSFLILDLIQSLIFDVNFYQLENDIVKIQGSLQEKCGIQSCYNKSIESYLSHRKLYREKKTGGYLIGRRDLTLIFFITIGSVFIIHFVILIFTSLDRFCEIKNTRTNRHCVTTVQGLNNKFQIFFFVFKQKMNFLAQSFFRTYLSQFCWIHHWLWIFLLDSWKRCWWFLVRLF